MTAKKQSKFTDALQGKKLGPTNKPTNPLWNISHGITFSSLSKWLTCPEQFSLQWIDGLAPKKLSVPIEFGNLIHYALEHQLTTTHSPREVIYHVGSQYYEHRMKTVTNSKERDTLQYLVQLAIVVFPLYCDFWNYDDHNVTWIQREAKFKVKHRFQTPEGEKEILLTGMRDGLYQYGNTYGVFETKTKSRIVEKDIMDNLQCDLQTMLYAWSTYLDTGRYPNQIKYNVIRRPDDHVPYRNVGMKDAAYLKKVEDDIRSRPEFYFKRYTATLVQQDIDTFVNKTLNPILNLFLQWNDSIKKNPLGEGRFQSPYHYLNSANLVGKFGKAEMWDAIFGNMQPYKVRSEVFPELADSFQAILPEHSTLQEHLSTSDSPELEEAPF